MMTRTILTSLMMFAVTGCGSQQRQTEEAHDFPDANDPAYAASFDGEVDPRVSTSPGEEGGVIVLWPRVVPAEGAEGVADQAAALQRRLRNLVERVLPEHPIDVRPAPERVCPRAGCSGIAVGSVLVHSGRGCAAAVTVSRPGQSPARLVAWTTSTVLRSGTVPFREPPESQLMVRDFTTCEGLVEALDDNEEEVERAVRIAAGE